MKVSVELHGTGKWNDEVGAHFNKISLNSVNDFNLAADKFEHAIKAVDAYNEDNINYESQKEKLYGMRIEFNG